MFFTQCDKEFAGPVAELMRPKQQCGISIKAVVGRVFVRLLPVPWTLETQDDISPVAVSDCLIDKVVLAPQCPSSHQFGFAVGLKDRGVGDAVRIRIQNSNDRFPTHPTNTQTVGFSTRQSRQPVGQSHLGVESGQRRLRIRIRLSLVLDRDPTLNPAGR